MTSRKTKPARLAPPSPEHREWTAAQVEAHAIEALKVALDYFRIPDHWEVILCMSGTEPGSAGEIGIDHTYLRGVISLNVEVLRGCPRKVWEVVGHEVARLADAPYDLLWNSLPEKVQGKHEGAYTRAMENAVTQRTRMFLRDVPDPAFMDGV